MTIQEFSDNYNAYLQIFAEDHQHYEELKQDGTWKPIPQNTAVMDFNDDRSNHRMEFEYELEEEYVKAVSVYHDWNKVSYLYPLTGEPLNLLTQKDCGILELAELTELYWQCAGNKTASFDYKYLTIEWRIIAELPMEGIAIFNEGDDAAKAQLYFRITIH